MQLFLFHDERAGSATFTPGNPGPCLALELGPSIGMYRLLPVVLGLSSFQIHWLFVTKLRVGHDALVCGAYVNFTIKRLLCKYVIHNFAVIYFMNSITQ